MIDRNQLLRTLGDASVSDWVLVERAREIATVDEATRAARHEQRTRWTVIVHVDAVGGRGSARVELDASDDRAVDVVLEGMALARANIGPIWASQPPSAPARVTVVDPDLVIKKAPPLAAQLERFATSVKRPDGAKLALHASLELDRVTVDTRAGFHATWQESLARASALVALERRSLEVTREARRFADLGLDAALADAVADLTTLDGASPAIAGPCAIVLATDAMLHGGGYGVWDIFAAFADSVVDRQGLTRYRLDAPIASGSDAVPEPLSIRSNGALEFGVRSAPVGDEGEAVREFPLVERGIAVGFGLTPREAALRHRDPNGGVRDLQVSLGTWTEALPTGARTIELRRLRDLSVDRYTGDATFEIALGIEHSAGTARAFTGGTVRLDLVAALAKARRSRKPVRRGPFVGPAAVLVDGAELVS